MSFAEAWKRSADCAAAVHQIRNRLQSIIIEAALLKRNSVTGESAALARIGALAQDGASYLELFGEILPSPKFDGSVQLTKLNDVFTESGVSANGFPNGACVRCRHDALEALLRDLLADAIPFRGFRAVRSTANLKPRDRVEFCIELETGSPRISTATITPWMTAQQMTRDIGGTLELHSGDPPLVRLSLPSCNWESL
jgi:hypothetical protein